MLRELELMLDLRLDEMRRRDTDPAVQWLAEAARGRTDSDREARSLARWLTALGIRLQAWGEALAAHGAASAGGLEKPA